MQNINLTYENIYPHWYFWPPKVIPSKKSGEQAIPKYSIRPILVSPSTGVSNGAVIYSLKPLSHYHPLAESTMGYILLFSSKNSTIFHLLEHQQKQATMFLGQEAIRQNNS